MHTKSNIRNIVKDILSEHGITKAPVAVEDIVKKYGAEVQYRPFKESVSGFSYSEDGKKIIGINVTESSMRQRFTLAHELGHLKLGSGGLHYDQGSPINFRDKVSATGIRKKEVDANFFAAELLMPKDMLIADLQAIQEKTQDSETVAEQLAEKYNVSFFAMNVRLASLGLVSI